MNHFLHQLPTLWLLSATSAMAVGQPVWNIADHGATPDRDAAPVINEGLRTQPEHGLPVYIPSGRWGIASTILLPKVDGGALIGVGMAGTSSNAFRGLGTILEWYGEPDTPMMELRGVRWRIENLSLRGIPFGRQGERAAIGLLVTKTGRGLGTGKSEFRNLMLEELQVGVQCGLEPNENNNDLLGFHRLVIGDCGIGYRSVNSQAMSHMIDRLEVRETPVAFRFEGGGMLHVRNVFTVSTTLLEIARNDPPQASPGRNNAMFTFEDLKVDAQHRGRFVLVSTHPQSEGVVVLNRGLVSGPSPLALARLGRGMKLVLRDFWSPAQQVDIAKHAAATVVLDNAWAKVVEFDPTQQRFAAPRE
ncbi:MAG: hypothetical protein AAGJ46_14870 [Planctomycetota bacterium]